MKQYKIVTAIVLLLCSQNTDAQLVLHKSVVASSSASYSSPGLSADWTVGQTVANQYTSSGLTITEGFHPIEANASAPPTGITVKNNIVSVKAYPNPTSNILNITIEQNKPETITIQVLDETGRVMKNVITLPAQESVNTEVDMSSLSPGTYLFMINALTKDAYVMRVVKQ